MNEDKRICLMCNKPFKSKGPHNRRCKVCNLKIYQAGENTYFEKSVNKMYQKGVSKE